MKRFFYEMIAYIMYNFKVLFYGLKEKQRIKNTSY